VTRLSVGRPWPQHVHLDAARQQARDQALDAGVVALAELLGPGITEGAVRLGVTAVCDAALPVMEEAAWLFTPGAAKLQQCQERLDATREDLRQAEHEIALWKRPPTEGMP
jgi:hypothetical protein